MPIFQQIDGKWVTPAGSPRAFVTPAGGGTGSWVPAEYVWAFAQGAWRVVWPDPTRIETVLTVDATGGVWPANGSVTVSIKQTEVQVALPGRGPGDEESETPESKAGINTPSEPLPGLVYVNSGSWNTSFPARNGSATFTLPSRNADTYTVSASWSEDPTVTGTDTYAITKGTPTIQLDPPQQTINNGQWCNITTRVRFNGTYAPAGGVTEIARQAHTNGPMNGYYDARTYTGGDITRSVAPEQSIVWHTRLTGHPNLNDVSAGCTTWVNRVQYGYTDVAAQGAKTYKGNGGTRKDNYPVYHGYYDSTWGNQHGFIWFPPLSVDKTCTRVEIVWYAQWTWWVGSNARIRAGYHTLPAFPSSVNYGDSRIWRGAHEWATSRGASFWVDLPHMPGYVNGYRSGGFGLVVGDGSTSNTYYGYGYPTTIRYHWEKWY